MPVYYSIYLEAKIDGRWECISPMIRLTKKRQESNGAAYRFAPIYESTGSNVADFIRDSDYFTPGQAGIRTIDPELLRQCVSGELYEKLQDPDFVPEARSMLEYEVNSPTVIDSYGINQISELAKQETDTGGFFQKTQAERIKKGDAEWFEYPLDISDIPKDLPEYLFNSMYEYVEYVLPGGDLWHAKEFMKNIWYAISMYNSVNFLYDEDAITLDKCRLICSVS